MRFDPKIHHRRSIRLKGYDYTQAGAYFVTIVAWQREMLFGEIVNGETPQGGDVVLNSFGKIVAEKWQWLETQYEYVELGAWVIMPNHLHGILVIHDNGRGGSRPAPTPPIKTKPLGGLIGAFKTVSTKHINLLRGTEGIPVWQRNYYEHIIRNEPEMDRITRYIESNPLRWVDDDENPNRIQK